MESKDEKLKPYYNRLENLKKKFELVTFFYLPKDENQLTDSLTTLASMIKIVIRVKTMPLIIEQRYELSFCIIVAIEEEGEGPLWYQDI